jgi:tRNA (guanine-N7-)-methyltransferase
MPRRALRKIDPTLELSRYLKLPADLPRPWDADALFDHAAPLEIEVGSGKGLFLHSAASQNPGHNFLGIEIATKYARFAAARAAASGLKNAVMVHGDAQPIFADRLPDNCVAAVHVYFPDPWWKKRHEKRKVLNERFVKQVERVLIPGGSLHYWTDVRDRFKATLELLAKETTFDGPLEVPEREAEHDLDYRTHFERRTRLAALPVYRSEFRKRG